MCNLIYVRLLKFLPDNDWGFVICYAESSAKPVQRLLNFFGATYCSPMFSEPMHLSSLRTEKAPGIT